MSSKDEKDEERKGGAVPFVTAGGPSAGRLTFGARLQSLGKDFLIAPGFSLARGLFVAALVVSAAWLSSSIYTQLGAPPSDGVEVPAPPMSGSLSRTEDGGSSLMPMLGGLRLILNPAALGDGSVEGAPADASSGGTAGGEGPSAKKASSEDGKGEAGAASSGEGENASGSAASPLSGSSGGGSGASGTSAGPAGSGAVQAPGAADAAPAGERAGSLGRPPVAASLRGGRVAASKGGRGRDAMKQLKFAKDMSNYGANSATREGGFSAAEAAFSGQSPVGGSPDGAAGMSQGGSGLNEGLPPSGNLTVGNPSCPSGYFLNGSVCSPMTGESGNTTPYQKEVDGARRMILIAAVLFAIGLALLAFTAVPVLNVLGGLLLGLALILIVAASAIGDDLGRRYGQAAQGEAVKRAAAAAAQGQTPQ
ncbi:MAG: hypothetical protein WC969_07560 [Elusimicrobiota bacterium]|jgi:hypothetical protein